MLRRAQWPRRSLPASPQGVRRIEERLVPLGGFSSPQRLTLSCCCRDRLGGEPNALCVSCWGHPGLPGTILHFESYQVLIDKRNNQPGSHRLQAFNYAARNRILGNGYESRDPGPALKLSGYRSAHGVDGFQNSPCAKRNWRIQPQSQTLC